MVVGLHDEGLLELVEGNSLTLESWRDGIAWPSRATTAMEALPTEYFCSEELQTKLESNGIRGKTICRIGNISGEKTE